MSPPAVYGNVVEYIAGSSRDTLRLAAFADLRRPSVSGFLHGHAHQLDALPAARHSGPL